jgi:NADH-quinone oxidoreductase subunit F
VAKAAARPHYLVCNADESEPGTFKDRVLMEMDPFAVVEGMAIAALATGCEKGFIYIRTEYPLARRRVEQAIAESRASGVLDLDIEVRRGAGAYICGEETALFNSIEGERGEPRNKPPFPVEAGLFGKPTLVNNVETLVNVLGIVNGDFANTRLFCVSGHVAAPGVYEVPMGTPLSDLLEQAGARNIRAVLLGGAAGSFLTPAQLDVPLSFEGTRAIGTTMGSGAVIVFDDSADLKKVMLRIARFFRDESCGQCVPCRVGTKRQEEILERMFSEHNGDDRADVMLLSDIAQAMRDASICGLGQTAANAIASGLTQLKVLNG